MKTRRMTLPPSPCHVPLSYFIDNLDVFFHACDTGYDQFPAIVLQGFHSCPFCQSFNLVIALFILNGIPYNPVNFQNLMNCCSPAVTRVIAFGAPLPLCRIRLPFIIVSSLPLAPYSSLQFKQIFFTNLCATIPLVMQPPKA